MVLSYVAVHLWLDWVNAAKEDHTKAYDVCAWLLPFLVPCQLDLHLFTCVRWGGRLVYCLISPCLRLSLANPRRQSGISCFLVRSYLRPLLALRMLGHDAAVVIVIWGSRRYCLMDCQEDSETMLTKRTLDVVRWRILGGG